MATLLKANGSSKEVQPINGKSFSLAELQGFVGGYIEIAQVYSLPSNIRGTILVVNEEGKLKHLTLNIEATRLHGVPNDPIVGDALLCSNHEVR